MLENFQNWAIGVGLLAGLTWALKALPGLLEAKATAALDKMFALGDDNDDRLIIAMINWAERKYGPGTGSVKAAAVVDWMLSRLPLHYRVFATDKVRAKAVELLQKSFDCMEDTLNREAKEHGSKL
jgi:hypothetical protein